MLLTGCFALLLPLGWITPTPIDAAWIAFNGASNAVGQYWWTRALHLAPASAVSPFYYLSLIWASILGFAIWGEVPTMALVIGSAIVVASGLFLLWRESNARQAVGSGRSGVIRSLVLARAHLRDRGKFCSNSVTFPGDEPCMSCRSPPIS